MKKLSSAILFGLMIKLINAHLNEQCHFNMCLKNLVIPIKHAYCDSDNYCRCEEGYVAVNNHHCAQIQYPGHPCEHDVVCKDENSFCNHATYHHVCECKKNHLYDPLQKKCVPYVKKSRKSTPLFPMTAIILIACIGIFCGCGIICHNFRSHPELSNMNNAIRNRNHRYPRRRSNSASRQTNDHIITADSSETAGPSLLRAGSLSGSSKFDSIIIYDEPPPRYEDAIKGYPDAIVIDSSTIASNQTVAAKS
ncbi:hypothetical protein SSS_01521 [Sarcoptes scabiei]|uniref:EB domain-containing protein n=1 Tax=Sarcoptes scabiei TaxID=52283 RepID=A0A834VGF6_SARSC|nr:hypothetical protein SSS_01521 [Sarcoptes scabiei]